MGYRSVAIIKKIDEKVQRGNLMAQKGRKRILIVEDEELIAKMLIEYFELVAPEFEFEIAKNLREAREKLAQGKWALCICDCRLPDGSACELFWEKAFRCPVIVTTGYVDQEEFAKAQSSYPQLKAIIKKPYLPAQLHQRIKEILKD
jgi:DNA-binding NtrC family response regulator